MLTDGTDFSGGVPACVEGPRAPLDSSARRPRPRPLPGHRLPARTDATPRRGLRAPEQHFAQPGILPRSSAAVGQSSDHEIWPWRGAPRLSSTPGGSHPPARGRPPDTPGQPRASRRTPSFRHAIPTPPNNDPRVTPRTATAPQSGARTTSVGGMDAGAGVLRREVVGRVTRTPRRSAAGRGPKISGTVVAGSGLRRPGGRARRSRRT
jgi:hypothetical protein